LKSLKINYTKLNNVGFNEILFFFRGTIDLTLDLQSKWSSSKLTKEPKSKMCG
jgi:hypothetical protein